MSTPTKDDGLLAAHRRMMEALKRSDAAEIVALFAEDPVLMPPNDTAIYGKEELAEWYREYFDHFRITGLADMDRHVTLVENYAIERWGYQVGIQPVHGGERIVDEGRFLMVWHHDDDVWKISQAIWNSSRPIGSGTSRFMALLKERLNARARPE